MGPWSPWNVFKNVGPTSAIGYGLLGKGLNVATGQEDQDVRAAEWARLRGGVMPYVQARAWGEVSPASHIRMMRSPDHPFGPMRYEGE